MLVFIRNGWCVRHMDVCFPFSFSSLQHIHGLTTELVFLFQQNVNFTVRLCSLLKGLNCYWFPCRRLLWHQVKWVATAIWLVGMNHLLSGHREILHFMWWPNYRIQNKAIIALLPTWYLLYMQGIVHTSTAHVLDDFLYHSNMAKQGYSYTM